MKHKQDIYKKPKIPVKEIISRLTIGVFLLSFISFEISAYLEKIPNLGRIELPSFDFETSTEDVALPEKNEITNDSETVVDATESSEVAIERDEESDEQESASLESSDEVAKVAVVNTTNVTTSNEDSVVDQKAKEKTLIKMMLANDDPHQKFGSVSLMDKALAENDPFKMQSMVLNYEYFSAEDKEKILIKEIKANHPMTVKKLLDKGFALIQPYPKANQLIFKRQYKMAILLLKRGVVSPKAKNKYGYTLLHEAAAKGHAKLIRLLVSLGADINAQANDGASALHYPAHLGFNIAVSTLIDLGIDLNMRATLKYPGLHWDGYTPLLVAANRGKFAIVDKLLKAGANIDAVDNKGRTAYQIATEKRYSKVIKLLTAYLEKDMGSSMTDSNTTINSSETVNESQEDEQS